MQLKRVAALGDPGYTCTVRPGWRDMLCELKGALRDLKTGDYLEDRHLKMASIYRIAREATCILERAASLSCHRLPVRNAPQQAPCRPHPPTIRPRPPARERAAARTAGDDGHD